MNQEIKDKLEQATAHYDTSDYDACNHKSGFLAGAQTILENPGEWFPPVQYWQLREENEQLKSQLSRYRAALLGVHELTRLADPHCRDSAIEEMKDIIEEALKQ